jgi:DHA2 family methylenomycin A resistance protein-like MFS transporter
VRTRDQRLTLLVMCIATFMIQLDVTVVNVALPRIQTDLRLGSAGLEWVISAYALSLAAGITVGGALGDHYGRRRVFLCGLSIFAAGSVACALSPNAPALVASRCVQGLGGAGMLALTLSIISEAFPPRARPAAIGTWAALGGTGFGVGPVVGGILLTYFDWAAVFWVNVPFAALAIVGTRAAVPESRNRQSRRLDVIGVMLSALGLVGVTVGLVEIGTHGWRSGVVAGPLVGGVVVLAGFVAWERRTPQAMLPLLLLRARSFVTASAIYLLSYMAFSSALFYATLLYQDVVGWSVLRTGLSWLFMNLPYLTMAQSTGRLDRRLPASIVVCGGCVIGGAGAIVLGCAGPTTPFALTAAGYLLMGTGFGILAPGITHVALRDVPSGVSGAASAVLNSSRQIGTSIGLAVFGAIGAAITEASWRNNQAGPAAMAQAHNVAGARIATVVDRLGPAYRHPAATAFASGYHLAVGLGAVCLFSAAAAALIGFRGPSPGPMPADRRRSARAAPTRRSDHRDPARSNARCW